jgi:hypothetical protein
MKGDVTKPVYVEQLHRNLDPINLHTLLYFLSSLLFPGSIECTMLVFASIKLILTPIFLE